MNVFDAVRDDARTGSRPLIAVTTYSEPARWGVWNRPAVIVPHQYLDAVDAAGGAPLLLPPQYSGVDMLDLAGGLIIVGGPDVSPAMYDELAHPTVRHTDPRRDAHELRLARAALERDLPVLAICRGAQLINVALGGSLHQHLPDINGTERHRPGPGTFGRIGVDIVPDTLTATILGERLSVPCYHHQALNRVAPGLVVTARAVDGTVEAVESPHHSWVVGVQWHPEEDLSDNRLFEALVQAAIAPHRPTVTH